MRNISRQMRWSYAIAMILLVACATTDVPSIVDRPSDPTLAKDEQVLLKSAAEIEQRLEDQQLLYRDRALEAYVQSIADRLLRATPATSAVQVRARVLESQTPDAFVLRNGALYVSRGLLSYLESEAQLATIVGRELLHFINRHDLKELRVERNHFRRGLVPGLVLITATVGLATPTLIAWTERAVDGFSRNLELQADSEVIAMLVAAGYRVDEAPAAFTALQIQSSEGLGERQSKLSREVSLAERVTSLNSAIATVPDAQRHAGHDGRAKFAATMRPIVMRMAEESFRRPAYNQTRAILVRYERTYGSCGRAHFLRAEIARFSASGYSGDDAALASYITAASFADVPAETFREMGLIYRRRGDSAAAQSAFRQYVLRQPNAGDAAIIRKYLEN